MSETTDQTAGEARKRPNATRWLVGLVVLAVAVGGTLFYREKMGLGRNRSTRVAERVVYNAPTTQLVAVEDWPKWRGPRGDGISKETGLLDEWPEAGPKQLWAAEVGIGQASPIAQQGRVYLFSQNNGIDTLTAFDANTGKIVWDSPGTAGWTGGYPGARATPAIDGEFIYTYGGNGDLICRTLSDGKQVWGMNVLKEAKSTNGGWGCASSPLIVGDLIYVQAREDGPVAAAVNKHDGKVAWTSEARGVGGYAHPILIDVEGTRQLIVFGGEAVIAMNPETGKTIWRQPWVTSYEVNASTPVYSNGHLFVTSGYGRGCMMLKVSPTGAEKLWEKKDIQSRFQQTILDGSVLYANSEGKLSAMRWPDGLLLWQLEEVKIGIGGSLVRLPGNYMILQSERGKVCLAKAETKGFAPISLFDAVDGTECWATPLVYGGRLYVKGTAELVCYDIAKPKE